jgi:hypothetical protein
VSWSSELFSPVDLISWEWVGDEYVALMVYIMDDRVGKRKRQRGPVLFSTHPNKMPTPPSGFQIEFWHKYILWLCFLFLFAIIDSTFINKRLLATTHGNASLFSLLFSLLSPWLTFAFCMNCCGLICPLSHSNSAHLIIKATIPFSLFPLSLSLTFQHEIHIPHNCSYSPTV